MIPILIMFAGWDYDVVYKNYWTNEAIYDNPEDVPPPADWEEIHTALQSDAPGMLDHTSTGTYSYSFGDTVPAGPREVAFGVVIEGDLGVSTLPQPEEVWKRTESGIERYFEDSALHYSYVGSSLEPGYSFSYTTWEDFNYTIHARSRIWARRSVVVGGQTYRDCVQCLMSLYSTPIRISDENGDTLGYAREEWFGETIFAPGIGIIYTRVRSRKPGPFAQDLPNSLVEDVVAVLSDYSVQDE